MTGNQPIRLKVAIEPSESSHADPLTVTEAIIPATGSVGVVTIRWTTDGVQPWVSIKARAEDGGGQLLRLNDLSYTRVADGRRGRPVTTSRVLWVSPTNSEPVR